MINYWLANKIAHTLSILGGELEIEEDDTFVLTWVSVYENSLNFYLEMYIYNYAQKHLAREDPLFVLSEDLKSSYHFNVTRGEVFSQHKDWRHAVIHTWTTARAAIVQILDSMRFDDSFIEIMMENIVEELVDNMFEEIHDPRLN